MVPTSGSSTVDYVQILNGNSEGPQSFKAGGGPLTQAVQVSGNEMYVQFFTGPTVTSSGTGFDSPPHIYSFSCAIKVQFNPSCYSQIFPVLCGEGDSNNVGDWTSFW